MSIISFQQQELLNFMQRAQTALHPKLDLRPSTFSKHVDKIFDVFRKEPVTDPKDREKGRFGAPGSLY
jgi:hypothetical protein